MRFGQKTTTPFHRISPSMPKIISSPTDTPSAVSHTKGSPTPVSLRLNHLPIPYTVRYLARRC